MDMPSKALENVVAAYAAFNGPAIVPASGSASASV